MSAEWKVAGRVVTDASDWIEAALDVAFGDGMTYTVTRDGKPVAYLTAPSDPQPESQ